MDDPEGSDAAALLHAHIPYAIAQAEALRRGEFPLWNRHLLLGNTLIGQGQSMIGDPLHWLVIASGGEAWAWDLKFVIARMALCAGVGLTVLALTGHTAAAMISGASVAFLSYFSFRYNHPAQFSLCYSPWILWAWVYLSRSGTVGSGLRRGAALVAANWWVFNSGTIKEAVILMLTLNATGILATLGDRRTRQTALIGLVWLLLFVALAAPIWLPFLESLQRSFNAYKDPMVRQLPPWTTAGLMDEIFLRPLTANGVVRAPGANLLVSLGFFAALLAPRLWQHCSMRRTLVAMSLVCWAIAYAAIPGEVFLKLPFLSSIYHIDNVFSCSLIVLMSILAGVGWAGICAGESIQRAAIAVFSVLLLYFAVLGFKAPERAWNAYTLAATGAVSILILGIYVLQRFKRLKMAGLFLLSLGVLGCVVRNVHHFHWEKVPGKHTINPGPRVPLIAKTPAVDFMRPPAGEAHRVLGLRGTLHGSYPAYLGMDGMFGVDALQNGRTRDLLKATFTPEALASNFPIVTPRSAEKSLPLLQFLNIRYLATMPDQPALDGYNPVFSGDLNILEVPGAWPRAFATNRLLPCGDVSELLHYIYTEREPFAGVDIQNDTAYRALLEARPEPATPARDYALLSNSTSFTVDTTGPAMIVLCEAGSPEEFSAIINGVPAPVHQVCWLYKGVMVESQGTHNVTFRYEPSTWPEAVRISGIAAVTALGVLLLSTRYRAPLTP